MFSRSPKPLLSSSAIIALAARGYNWSRKIGAEGGSIFLDYQYPQVGLHGLDRFGYEAVQAFRIGHDAGVEDDPDAPGAK
jgi:hypothetical protein